MMRWKRRKTSTIRSSKQFKRTRRYAVRARRSFRSSRRTYRGRRSIRQRFSYRRRLRRAMNQQAEVPAQITRWTDARVVSSFWSGSDLAKGHDNYSILEYIHDPSQYRTIFNNIGVSGGAKFNCPLIVGSHYSKLVFCIPCDGWNSSGGTANNWQSYAPVEIEVYVSTARRSMLLTDGLDPSTINSSLFHNTIVTSFASSGCDVGSLRRFPLKMNDWLTQFKHRRLYRGVLKPGFRKTVVVSSKRKRMLNWEDVDQAGITAVGGFTKIIWCVYRGVQASVSSQNNQPVVNSFTSPKFAFESQNYLYWKKGSTTPIRSDTLSNLYASAVGPGDTYQNFTSEIVRNAHY
jgi:hypothetical protein